MKVASTLILLLSMTAVSIAQELKPIPLFPKGAPGAKPAPATYTEKTVSQRVSMVTDPAITLFLPEKDKANGTAVIICPGGAYIRLAIDKEGYDVARKFNEQGIAAFVLKYRLPSDVIMADKSIGPLQDAQRAIQVVRERAKEWGINVNKVGIVGFSAGGHLASTAITHFKKAVIDNPLGTNLRPDFGVLLYPVISFGELAHKGSRENLIGKTPSNELVELYSNEKQVTAQTPPTFLVHAQDDKTVPVLNSVVFYEALTKAGVKGELHIYQAGGHGFGLNNPTTSDQWFERCISWMKGNGWLGKL